MIELKPCPFCGGEAEMYQYRYNFRYHFKARCNNDCQIRPTTLDYSTEEEAAKVWNRREPEGI